MDEPQATAAAYAGLESHHDVSAIVAAAIAVIGWSSAFVGLAYALRGIEPGPLVLIRFLVGSLCFLLLAAAGYVRLPALRDASSLLAIGLIGHALYQLSLAYSETRISAGAAASLSCMIPVMSAILAMPILSEFPSARAWIGMALALLGAGFITVGGEARLHFEPKSLFALLAAAASAVFFVFQKPWLRRYSALEITAYSVWSSCIVALVYAPALLRIRSVPVAAILSGVYLGIVPTTLCYSLWAFALKRSSTARITSFLYLEPPATFVFAWVLIGEKPTFVILLGAAAALAGVIVVNSSESSRPHQT